MRSVDDRAIAIGREGAVAASDMLGNPRIEAARPHLPLADAPLAA